MKTLIQPLTDHTYTISSKDSFISTWRSTQFDPQGRFSPWDPWGFMQANRPNRHPTVQLEFNGGAALVDVEIAPLIQKLWDLDMPTLGCCQGDPSSTGRQRQRRNDKRRAYILFVRPEDAKRFARMCLGPNSRGRWRVEKRGVVRFPKEDIKEALWRL